MEVSEQSIELLERLFDLIVYVNKDFKILESDSEKILEFLGYNFSKIVGKNFFNFVKNKEKYNQCEFSSLNSRKTLKNLKILHKEGFYINFEAEILFIPKNDRSLILLAKKDDREELQDFTCVKVLNEVENCFISENINDLVSIINLDFKYVYINETAYMRTLGYDSEDLIGKSVDNIIHKDDIKKARIAFDYGIKQGEGIIELRLRKKEGGCLWFEIKGKTFHNNRNELLGLFISRNINERKLMEAKLKNSEEKLRLMNKNLEDLIEKRTHQLKESREKYRLITENVRDIVSVFDENLNLLYINESQERISGFTKEELRGKNMMAYLHPDDIQKAVKFFREVKSRGFSSGEFRQRRKDGTYTWLETTCKRIIDSGGKIKYIFATKEINKKKEIERKLKESEEKYSNLFKFSNDGIIIHDMTGEIIDANRKALKLFGYDKEKILDLKMYQLHPKSKIEDVAKMWNHFREEGFNRSELEYKRKNGEVFLGEISNSLFKVGNKDLVQVSIRDITKRKETEYKLRASETKYRHLFEDSPFIILLLNIEGEILDINQACEDKIGISKDHIIGKKFFELNHIIDPQYIPIMRERFQNLITTGGSQPKEAPAKDVKIFDKTGKAIWIKFSSIRVKIGHNQIIIQSFGHDVTEQKKAELLIKKEIQKLKELDQMRKDLITRISHEVKTPLMSIEGSSELLLELYKDSLGEEELELIRMNKRGANKLSRLVENLLDVSRLEYNKLKLEKEPTNLSNLVKEATEELGFLIRKRDIDVSVNLPEKLVLKVDNLRIEQVFTNLLTNSLKNTPPGGKIQLFLEKNGDWAKFVIKDSGIGLTDEELERIFTHFGKIERTSEESEDLDISGCGIGLYISKEIVNLHGGKIIAKSEGRNKGSKFVVKLPLKN
jgi:PAS domain S-box-containing protein